MLKHLRPRSSRRTRFTAALLSILSLTACATATTDSPEDTTATSSAVDTSPVAQQIRKVYGDVLGRTPADWEVQVWKNNIQSGAWTLDTMRAAFAQDDQCKSAIVRVYSDTLERTPLEWEINIWRNNLRAGWSIAGMRDAFAHSDEARAKIIAIYQQVLFRTPEAWEVAAWQTNLSTNGWSLAGMRGAFESSAISVSGLHLTAAGKILVTQGVTGSKLVAGKHVFAGSFVSDANAARVSTISFSVRDGGGVTRGATLSASSLICVNGAVSGIEIGGALFPRAGIYTLKLTALDAGGAVVAQTGDTTLTFVAAKDIRLLVSLIMKPNRPGLTPDPSWYADLDAGMQRLNAMLPVRDGVAKLNADKHSGLRYETIECNGFDPGLGYSDCTYGRARAINATAGDHVDVVVEWRPGVYSGPTQTDYSPGGNSGAPAAPYSDIRRASCVAGVWRGVSITGSCVAQEIGHNFGLEPSGSPHFQDTNDPGHSKDRALGDPYAYDFVHHTPLASGPDGFSGDTMNNSQGQGGAFEGQDAAAYNAYDFNYLLDQVAKLPSTGTEANP